MERSENENYKTFKLLHHFFLIIPNWFNNSFLSFFFFLFYTLIKKRMSEGDFNTMLSVRNMLTVSQQQYRQPRPMEPNINAPILFNDHHYYEKKSTSVLNISSLLCAGDIPEHPIQLPPPIPQPQLQPQQVAHPYPHHHSSIQRQQQGREQSIERETSLDQEEEQAYVQKLWSRQPSKPHFYYLLDKHQRQHQIKTQKIKQELLHDRRKSSSSSSSTSSLIYSLSSSSSSSSSSKKAKLYPRLHQQQDKDDDEGELPLKAKIRRASTKQLDVLNKVFERTFFPSTQLRAELGRQLGMSPRTVQIWFQNRRQAIRTKERTTGSVSNQSSRENSLE